MVMANLPETENDEMEPEKQKRQIEGDERKATRRRRRDGFFNTVANNTISQLPLRTTFKLFKNSKINLLPVQRKNSKTLLNYCALIQRHKNKAKNAQLAN